MSADVQRQVEDATGILAMPSREPGFVRAIRLAKNDLPDRLAPLVDFCATVVSETLITGTLSRVPEDQQVLSLVRESLADHAADERTHHAYFTRAFEVVWPQLDRQTQRLLAPHFADFIIGFLDPDLAGQHDALLRMGLTSEESATILLEANPSDHTRAGIRHAARSTLRLLDRMEVTQEGNAMERFYILGIMSGENYFEESGQ